MRVKPKEYERIDQCLENGIDWGWQHAHKHNENPSFEDIKDHLIRDIMNEICEEFDFEPYDE